MAFLFGWTESPERLGWRGELNKGQKKAAGMWYTDCIVDAVEAYIQHQLPKVATPDDLKFSFYTSPAPPMVASASLTKCDFACEMFEKGQRGLKEYFSNEMNSLRYFIHTPVSQAFRQM